ncbi:hypothetical protein K435DRAFT_881371 [Dendrothele bispora CBS 962.96]|uniref:Uncharacterized protein n=1 Tax=Dendrothele bispora (strain CBS 962.96) TaxID=1314807 RepID=A0A4S8KIG5_DENBC|nr:hypothetical protein K435DRAFT_881371 [Dendrothele bispora CBS 962.96]
MVHPSFFVYEYFEDFGIPSDSSISGNQKSAGGTGAGGTGAGTGGYAGTGGCAGTSNMYYNVEIFINHVCAV